MKFIKLVLIFYLFVEHNRTALYYVEKFAALLILTEYELVFGKLDLWKAGVNFVH